MGLPSVLILLLHMFLPKNNTPRWIIIVIDLFLSLFGLIFAYLIRFDFKLPAVLFDHWEKDISDKFYNDYSKQCSLV